MKKTLNRYIFTGPNWEGEIGEIASYGETPEQAKDRISGGEKYTLTRVESLPYAHANLVAEICENLPGTWFAKPDSEEYPNCGWNISSGDTSENKLTLHVSPPGYSNNGKFSISLNASGKNGCYVEVRDEKHNRIPHPSIGCSETKTGKQIAADVARRLLPEAVRVNNLVAAKLSKEEGDLAKRRQAVREVCVALKCEVPAARHNTENEFWGYGDKVSKWTVDYSGGVTLEIRCNPGQVAAIVAAL